MDKDKRSIFKNLALLTQLALHVMVPTALCVALGVVIDNRFGTYWVIPLLFLGMAAGGRNAYKLAMASARDDSAKPDGKDDKNGQSGQGDA